MKKIALLMIDVQKGLRAELNTEFQRKFDEAIMYMNVTSDLFRDAELPVVIVQDVSVGDVASDDFACVDELNIASDDIVIHKAYNNAFWETELEQILKGHGIEAVVVSGFAAEYCVLFSYNGAKERGFKAFVLQHGVAGETEAGIDAIQSLRPVISYEALSFILKS